jgi:hypothetical protein
MSKSPNRLLATVFGAVYLVVGLVGFIATSAAGAGFISTRGGFIFGLFEVNVLHNVAHLIIGAALLLAGLSGVGASKGANTTIGVVYLLLGIVGLFIVNSSLNILAINGADNALHFGSAIILLVVGLGADKGGARVNTGRRVSA